MTKPKLTWREKRLAKEEDDGSGGSSGEEEQEMASARGDPNPESGNSNPGSGILNPSEKEDWLGEEPTQMDVSMVFTILQNSMHRQKMSQSWCCVLNVPCSRSQKTRSRT
jgi:hypothetical protein